MAVRSYTQRDQKKVRKLYFENTNGENSNMREVFQKMRFVPLGSILSGTLVISLVIVGLSMLLLGRAGDVESNPGPGRLGETMAE